MQTIVRGFNRKFACIDKYNREGIVLKPEIAFGHILRQCRKNKKISQEKLAQESGLDRTYISLLERGLRQPSLTSILQISRALNVPSSELISKVEVMLNENNTV